MRPASSIGVTIAQKTRRNARPECVARAHRQYTPADMRSTTGHDEHSSPSAPAGTAQRGSRAGHAADLAFILALALVWVFGIGTLTQWKRTAWFDTFRDMAWAHNMLEGRFWADPTIPGYSFWYPPGNPLLHAGVGALGGWSVADVYGYSGIWLNVWLPIALYLLVRIAIGRLAAILALMTVLFGSIAWLTHVAGNIPGVEALGLNLLGLLLWHKCGLATVDGSRAAASWAWAVATGVVLALTAWYHPLCAMVLAASIFIHAVLRAAAPPRAARHRLAVRMAVVAAVSFALAAPLIWHMLRIQSARSALLQFFAPELIEPDFYAQSLTPLVVLASLLGFWEIARRRRQLLWIPAYASVSLFGLALGYLGSRPHIDLPYLLPHEFLWHGQLAIGIAAAVGLESAGRRLTDAIERSWTECRRRRETASPAHITPYIQSRRAAQPAAAILAIMLCIAIVWPAFAAVGRIDEYFWDLELLLQETGGLAPWVKANTSIDDCFVAPPDQGYLIIAGLTGRKCVAVAPGHMHPLVPREERERAVRVMLETEDEATLLELARRYNVSYVFFPFTHASPDAVAARYAGWPHVALAWQSADGLLAIYRISPDPAADELPANPSQAEPPP